MIKKKTLTPIILTGIFCIMLGFSFAAVPLYDLFCRVTGFEGTTGGPNSTLTDAFVVATVRINEAQYKAPVNAVT